MPGVQDKEMITVGELFAGIGGIGLGLEMTGGFEVKWQVERDKYALQVLEKHWPEVVRHNDVLTFPPDDSDKWNVDVICGGFPCQDISNAGKRKGLDGERSGLFYEIVRIAKRLRPKYLLLENVSALLVRGLGDVLRELATLGYDAEWHCIPAAAVGAPHRRDRVFIVAYCDSHDRWNGSSSEPQKRDSRLELGGSSKRQLKQKTNTNVADSDGDREIGDQSKHRPRRGAIPRSEKEAALVADSTSGRLQGQGESKHASHKTSFCEGETIVSINGRFRDFWAVEPDVGRVADGVPSRMDRLRCLGNAVVPQVAQFLGERILEWEKCNETKEPEANDSSQRNSRNFLG